MDDDDGLDADLSAEVDRLRALDGLPPLDPTFLELWRRIDAGIGDPIARLGSLELFLDERGLTREYAEWVAPQYPDRPDLGIPGIVLPPRPPSPEAQ